jgi:hypothetical protein
MTGTLASNLPVMILSLALRPIGKKAVGFVSVSTCRSETCFDQSNLCLRLRIADEAPSESRDFII